MRYLSSSALGQLGNANDSIVQTLVSLLNDDDSSVRSRAAESLVQLGNANDNVVQTLIALLKDDDSSVRSRAAESLVQLGPQSNKLKPLLVHWIEQHQTKHFVSHGIDVLQTLVR